jgi:hypothetical protein
MAELRPIARPKCRCGKVATRELVNRRRSVVGYYCGACGVAELERHLVFERREDDVAQGAYTEEINDG